MFVMYDSVNLNEIPAEPHAVGAYINGDYENYEEAKRRFPHARILGISVRDVVAADCYDIERGDYNPDQVGELYHYAVEHGIWRPCFYAQLSGVMPAVKKVLNDIVHQRDQVRTWVAYYNGRPAHPQDTGDDAHQFTDKALGRSLDESICLDSFFPAAHKPVEPTKPAEPSKPASDYLAVATVTFDPDDGQWTISGQPSEQKTK